MFDRFVSIALIMTFLPLPGMNSFSTLQFMSHVSSDSADRSADGFSFRESGPSDGRFVEIPLTFDPVLPFYCEVENELSEFESQKMEEDTIGLPFLSAPSVRNRELTIFYGCGACEYLRNFDSQRSRHHNLRC